MIADGSLPGSRVGLDWINPGFEIDGFEWDADNHTFRIALELTRIDEFERNLPG